MKSDESAMSGRAARIVGDQRLVGGDVVLAVHRREDAVRPRLHGQMQERHQGRQVAMRRDEVRSMSRGWLVV